MLTLISIQNSSAHQVWPRIPYTHLRIRSLRDQASRSNPIRSSESDDAIPDPDPDPMIGSFDPNHDSTDWRLYFDRISSVVGAYSWGIYGLPKAHPSLSGHIHNHRALC